jgi:hypothetical protein
VVRRLTLLCALLGTSCTEYAFSDKTPSETFDTGSMSPGTTPDTAPTTPDTTPTTPPYTDPPFGGVPIAEAPVYANTRDTLYEVVPDSGDTIPIGRFASASGAAVDTMVDIAIDPSGRMYGGSGETLYRIDPTTAAVRAACTVDVAMTALASDDDGFLYAGGGNRIERIDPDTCAQTTLVSHPVYQTSGDLVGLPDGFLYWTIIGSSSDELVKVSPRSGSTELIGRVGADRLYGLGYSEGSLYGFSEDREIVRIDPATGSTSLLVPTSLEWWGATTNPVAW